MQTSRLTHVETLLYKMSLENFVSSKSPELTQVSGEIAAVAIGGRGPEALRRAPAWPRITARGWKEHSGGEDGRGGAGPLAGHRELRKALSFYPSDREGALTAGAEAQR